MESELLNTIRILQEEIVKNRTEIKSAIEASETRLLFKIEELKQKTHNLEIENQTLKNKVEFLERNSKKNNILIFGLGRSEEISATSVTKKLRELLDVDVRETDLNNLYRLNKSEKKPVKIELISYLKKGEILRQCKKLKGTGIAISHDLTYEQRREQKVLREFLNRSRQNPLDHAYIKGNKLYVNDKTYTVEELQEINDSEERHVNSAPATPNIRKPEKEFELQQEIDDTQQPQEIYKEPEGKINENTPKTSNPKKTIKFIATDPCLYILRFAAKLQFGAKTQLVANTALRLVQRMKRDSLHTGRRPSGLCGAALLMAARLHEFSRSPGDIVKIVKVHESTLRKRLIEFGETPSSALTLDEFMTIDLEEEQDPPSFKAARKKDKERLQRLMEEEAENFTDLQKQIEIQLEKDGAKRRPPSRLGLKREFHEQQDADKFIEESTLGTLKNILEEEQVDDITEETPFTGLGPDIQSMGLANSIDDTSNALQTNPPLEMELTFDDLDEAELDTYIMTEEEFKCKKGLWYERNATYLEERKAKAEKAQKEREEGKPEKKRKRTSKKRNMGPATSAGEAIEKILIEKKISTKINYDVLKSLNSAPQNDVVTEDEEDDPSTSESVKQPRLSNSIEESQSKSSRRKTKQVPGGIGLPVNDVTETQEKRTDVEINENVDTDDTPKKVEASTMSEEEAEEDYYDEEPAPDESANEMGVLQMLRQHREDEDDNNPYDYEYDDY